MGTLRLIGLALVVVLYFRRSGQLVTGREDLRSLRRLLAERSPSEADSTPARRLLIRLLGWSLRVRR